MAVEHNEGLSSPELASAQIVKVLDKITSTGYRPSAIFDDWLELTEATLTMLPAHFQSVMQTGQFAADSPEVAELWARMRARYVGKAWVFEKFAEAFGRLLNNTSGPDCTPTYQDIVGEVYTEWGRPSRSTGLFFTPWPVARLMAEMIGDQGLEVHQRLTAEIEQSPLAQACLLTGLALDGEAARQWFIESLHSAS